MNTCVSLPQVLEMGERIETDEDRSTTYDLFGIICHEGNDLTSGHYYGKFSLLAELCF